jgi:hypothetical protein
MLAGGCSPRTLIAVDPDPCADGGRGPGCPDPCADGGVINALPGCVPPGLLDDLIGYWRLDDASGSTTARDWSGRGNDGTLGGTLDPNTAWVAGRAAGGLATEGAGYVNVVPSTSIDSITNAVTVAGWAYLDGTIMDYATLASREEMTTIDQHYHISIDGNELPVFFCKTDVGGVRLTIRRTPSPVVRMMWVHIAGTYDGTTARLYFNGQQVDSQGLTGNFTRDTTPFILGGNGNGPDLGVSERFPGLIDEIMLYRRALSADEIAQLYGGVLFPSSSGVDGGADTGVRDAGTDGDARD